MKWNILLAVTVFLPICATAENPTVIISTNHGDITVELNKEKAPETVKNFLSYVEKKFYNGTVFHRVISNFMIQGGGFADGDPPEQKPTQAPIKNEATKAKLSNVRGSIAMARASAPHSATSQFFINVVDNSISLDAGGNSPDGYAVFGKVTKGMEVVDKIKGVKTSTKALRTAGGLRPMGDVPEKNVVIKTAVLVNKSVEKPKVKDQ